MSVLLLLLALLGAAATNHVADAVFAATPASPARDQGEGWYFREYAIEVGSNPGPGAGPGPLLATSPEYLRNFYPGSISLMAIWRTSMSSARLDITRRDASVGRFLQGLGVCS